MLTIAGGIILGFIGILIINALCEDDCAGFKALGKIIAVIFVIVLIIGFIRL